MFDSTASPIRSARALGVLLAGVGLLLGSRCHPPPREPPELLIYADSLWDAGDVSTCDLCALLPSGWTYRNFARTGAEVWHQRPCDGIPWPDPQCRNGFDRAVRQGSSCWAEVQGLPTCIADNLDARGPLVVAFTMNDANRGADDEAWNANELVRIVRDTTAILDSKPWSMACVLVVSPPIWENGDDVGGAELGTYLQYNQRIESIRSVYAQLATTYGCEVADIYQAYLDYELEYGDGATLPFYKDCPYKGADASRDCIHYSRPRPLLPAFVIAQAVMAAY